MANINISRISIDNIERIYKTYMNRNVIQLKQKSQTDRKTRQEGIMNTATLPRDIAVQMTATDQRVMDLLSDMIIRSGKKNPSKKEYVCPGEMWIGQRIDRCRQTISEAVQKLKRLGIIRVVQRRPVNGEWSTNLYRLGYWILRQMGRVKEATYAMGLPCRLKATHSSKTINNSRQTAAIKEFSHKLKGTDLDIYLKELTKKFGFET